MTKRSKKTPSMATNCKETNPLRKAAKGLGIIRCGQRDVSMLPVREYLAIACELRYNRLRNKGPLSQEGGEMIGRAVLTSQPISALTYICVSDYVGGERYEAQGFSFSPTGKEAEMFGRAQLLREICRQSGVQLDWRLVLADGWGLILYPERLLPGGIDAYCAFMQEECAKRGFDCIRWTEFMEENSAVYQAARASLDSQIGELIQWELRHGEIAHDKPNKERAPYLAEEHIRMRAAEGAVMVDRFGPTIVLSTESRELRRYDSLVVPRAVYNFVDYMPFYPHRLGPGDASAIAV